MRSSFQTLRFKVVADESATYQVNGDKVSSPADLAELVKPFLIDEPDEVLVMVGMNTKNKIIGVNVVYRGGTCGFATSARDIFRAALAMPTVTRIILAHNHPSGDPTPSTDDISTTTDLVAAAKILDIELLDHIVLGSVTGAWVRAGQKTMMVQPKENHR